MSASLGRVQHLEGSPTTSSNRFGTPGQTPMKQMILTGMATEQRFGSPEPQFFLVFNEGELRIPVPQETAETVVQAMYGGTNGTPTSAPPTSPDDDEDALHQDPPGYNNESDIPQA